MHIGHANFPRLPDSDAEPERGGRAKRGEARAKVGHAKVEPPKHKAVAYGSFLDAAQRLASNTSAKLKGAVSNTLNGESGDILAGIARKAFKDIKAAAEARKADGVTAEDAKAVLHDLEHEKMKLQTSKDKTADGQKTIFAYETVIDTINSSFNPNNAALKCGTEAIPFNVWDIWCGLHMRCFADKSATSCKFLRDGQDIQAILSA